VWTLNNWTEDELDALVAAGSELHEIQFLCFQKEVGENGTPHLQGYTRFKSKKTFDQVKEQLVERVHVEEAKGTEDQCIAYCTKTDTAVPGQTPYKFGTPAPGQGARMDIRKVIDTIIAHGEKKAWEEDPNVMVRLHRGIREAVLILGPKWVDGTKRKVIIHWGDAGSGKSRAFWNDLLPGTLYRKSAKGCGEQWWDGYNGEENVLVDEFSGQWDLEFWKRVCDESSVRGQTKGGWVDLKHTTICFTSNTDWRLWYPDLTDYNQKAFLRRITEVWKYEGNYLDGTSKRTDDKNDQPFTTSSFL